jgi:hypothetical protein
MNRRKENHFNDREITHFRPHEVARCGVSRPSEYRTIQRNDRPDNLKLRHIHLRSGPLAGMAYLGKARGRKRTGGVHR